MIRVIINRYFAEGMRENLLALQTKTRQNAIFSAGYISGESLQDMDDPQHNIVISSWRSKRDWEIWYSSSARKELAAEIAPMLDQPETITVFEIS